MGIHKNPQRERIRPGCSSKLILKNVPTTGILDDLAVFYKYITTIQLLKCNLNQTHSPPLFQRTPLPSIAVSASVQTVVLSFSS